MNVPPGVILAGGRSLRFGSKDKALAELDGRPLVRHVLERLAPQVCRLVINARSADAYAALGETVIPDVKSDNIGPLAGVLTALRWAETGLYEHVVSMPVDTPFIPRDLVARLTADGPADTPRIVSSNGRVHPICGLWPVAQANLLDTAIAHGVRSLRDWVDLAEAEVVEIAASPDDDPFMNINDMADLRAAQNRLSAQP